MKDDFFDAPLTASTSQALAVRRENAVDMYHSVPPALQQANLFFDSGLFPNARNAGGVFTIVQYGREVGLSPVVALNTVAIISGKLSMGGASMLALAIKHGVKATIVEESDKVCTIFFQREGYPDYTSTFTIEDAEKAELLKTDEKGRIKHDGWRKYPSQMLRWRSVSKGLKVVAPDVLAGVYTEEEIQSIGDQPAEKEDAKNDTPPVTVTPEPVAQKDTTPDKPKEKQEVAPTNRVTDGQKKMLHALLSERGLMPFRAEFKRFLSGFDGCGMSGPEPSTNDMDRSFASQVIGKFKAYCAQFCAIPTNKAMILTTAQSMSPDKVYSMVLGIKTLLDDADWFKIDPAERNVGKLSGLLELVLTGLCTQEHNRIAAKGNTNDGMSVQEAVETLKDLGMEPKLTTQTTAKPVEETLDF